MEQDPIQTDGRRARRERRLGEARACVLCGCEELSALIPVKRRLLEDHHVVGRAHNPDLTVALCRNCHARITEQLRCDGVPMEKQSTLLERLSAILKAFGSFLKMAGETLIRWAEQLAKLLTGLDVKCPEWRTMPEAQ